MKMLHRIQMLFRRKNLDAEMAEEMRHHVELQTELNIKAGMNPDEARYVALRQFGNVTSIQEQAREVRGWVWLEQVMQDFRYGWRQLRKAPGFASAAILTLAIGIGAATSIFSVVNSVLLRPLAYSDPERLLTLWETYPPDNRAGLVSRAAYLYWADQNSCFAGIAAIDPAVSNLTGVDEVERVNTLRVSPNYFTVLGVPPTIGRDFRPEEALAGKGNVVVLSHPFWLRKFAARADIVNQTVELNGESFTIIGVLPANVQMDAGKTACYLPLPASPADHENFNARDSVDVVARLKPGITFPQANAEMTSLAGALAAHYPAIKGRGVRLVPMLDEVLEHTMYGMSGIASLLFTLSGAVGFVLLIACVNVANLVLARASTRRKEIAMRATLGASRSRIVRQLLGESLLLAGLGGGLGTVLAYWSLGLVKSLAGNLPRAGEISLDGRVLAFSCLATLVTGIVFGLIPALQATGVDLVEAINNGAKTSEGRRPRRMRSVLVVLEVALALILLTAAGLLINSFVRLQQVDLGFRTEGIYANRLDLPPKKYSTPAQQLAFVDQVIQRVARLPQVRFVAFTSGMPIFGTRGAAFTVAGQSENLQGQIPTGLYAAITPQYLEAMGITVLRGRGFLESDTAGTPRVALISEFLARRYFPNQDPIGQRINITNGPQDWREIVGIVNDVKQWGPLSDTISPQLGNLYEPFAQKPTIVNLQLMVSATPGASNLPVALRSVIQSINRDLPLNTIYQLSEGIEASIARFRLSMRIFAFFSGIALLLAAIGIYGVIAHNVTQRTGEIGIRMAIGAQRRDVMRLVFADAGWLVGLGLLLGLVGAIAATRLLKALLFNVSNYDPFTFAGVAVLLAGVAFFATWLPARRAAKVDPVVALRAE
jgi:putative ABC transport system permease protein